MKGRNFILRNAQIRRLACESIMAAPDDAVVNIREKGRSPDQNNRMWAMLGDISEQADHNGMRHSGEVWKCLFMHSLGYETRFMHGLNGEVFPMGFRSSRLTVRQMNDLMTFMEAWCAENSVTLHHKEPSA